MASQTEDLQDIKDYKKTQLSTNEYIYVQFRTATSIHSDRRYTNICATRELSTDHKFFSLCLKKRPVYVHCSNCNQETVTFGRLVNTQKTHMLAGFICGLTFWCVHCCSSVIPYVIPTCKNAEHYCFL